MAKLPEKVAETLNALRKGSKHSLSVKIIHGGYYLYEEATKWNKQLKKQDFYSVYLGKIDDAGILTPPHHKKEVTKTETLEAYIAKRQHDEATGKNLRLSRIQDSIIKILSTDARIPVEEISTMIGIPYSTVAYQIKKLEKDLDIKYTLDTYAAYNFGFYRFIVTVKFRDKKPTTEEIKKSLGDDPHIQLVMLGRGEFDIFMYLLFDNTVNVEGWIFDLRKKEGLSKYTADWNVSYLLIGHGIIPLRDKFFELFEDRIWHRTKEMPRKGADQIYYREYAVLKELTKDGLKRFKEIDKDYKLNSGSAQYTYHELVAKGAIRRVTISMQKAPIKYNVIIQMKQVNMKRYMKSREKYFSYLLEDRGVPTNKISLLGDIGTPYGQVIIMPVYEDGDLDRIDEDLKSIVKGVELKITVVTNILIGSICYNKIEEKSTFMYNKLTSKQTNQIQNKSPYEEDDDSSY